MRGRGRRTAILTACTGWAIAWTLTLIAGHLGHGGNATTVFVLAMIAFGLAETCLSPSLTPIVNDLAPSTLTGRYNGLSTLAWTTGFLTGPAIAGLTLSTDHPTALFAALILASALAATATLRLRHHLPAGANTIGVPS